MKRIHAFCFLAAFALTGGRSLLGQVTRSKAATPELPAVREATAPQAIVPRFIKFSGTLVDLGGRPMAGVTDVTFALYSEEGGGTALWYETQTVETDALGRYTVLLGAMHANGVPVELFTTGEAKWLGIAPGNLPESAQGGRVLLVSVPYALKAMDAETLGGKPASAYLLASSEPEAPAEPATAPASPVVPEAPMPNLVGPKGKTRPKPLTATPAGATNFSASTTDQVVLVQQSGTGLGLLATAGSGTAVEGITSSSATNNFGGVYGISSASTGAGKGVFGQANSTTGVGVYGLAYASTGLTYGILGTANSTSGVGIQGQVVATTGNTVGIFGVDYSTSGIGLFGVNNATSGATIGVRAKVLSASGTAMYVDNTAGGKLISARNNGVEKFSLSGAGSGYFAGVVTIGTTVSGAGDLLTVNGPATASSFSVSSSIRWKSNVQPLEGALEKVENLRGVTYDWTATGQHQIGFIAEEVAPVVPEVVSFDKDHLPYGLDYSRLSALLVEAVKTQQAEIKSQQDEINELKSEVQQLRAREKKNRKSHSQ